MLGYLSSSLIIYSRKLALQVRIDVNFVQNILIKDTFNLDQ